MVQLTRKSQLTGNMNTMLLNTTKEQIERYANGEGLLQEMFPNLNVDEREFIKTGITPEEWLKAFGSDE